jgi:phospholipase C
MDGFVREYAEEYTLDGDGASHIMGYYDAANVPVYDDLAKRFLVCDRWFAAHPGPTFCNRFYYLTGRLNRDDFENFEVDNFSGANFKPVATRTIFDHLYEHGVSWRFYEQRYCTLRLYAKYSLDDQNIVDFADAANGFEACAAAGTLPSVTFIDPNFVDEPDAGDNDDAAPGNISAGQALIGRIVNALMNGPKWGKTLFIVTYDEHGGFFDHVNPLDPAYRANAVPVCGIDHYGVRVPTLIVSPWVAAGTASHVVFDHTSIIKTIARRFMSASPPDMGERVAAANGAMRTIDPFPTSAIFLSSDRSTSLTGRSQKLVSAYDSCRSR